MVRRAFPARPRAALRAKSANVAIPVTGPRKTPQEGAGPR